jgi:hypothetical protein
MPPGSLNSAQRLVRLLKFSRVLSSVLSDISDEHQIPILREINGPLTAVLETAQVLFESHLMCAITKCALVY